VHVTVAGHVNKTYSLAAINRTIARAVEYERPGRVRLLPVEGEPTAQLNEVPPEEYDFISMLAARRPHETGPVVVISQHYPIYVPTEPADARMALVFWEESLLPAATVEVLNQSFDAVLAPSQFVAKALLDSGVSLPVHCVGFAPELDEFLALYGAGARRAAEVFTFLHVSSCFPRKGVDVLLASYARAFRASDPVRLIIKTFENPHNDVAAQIAAWRHADPMAPMIEVIDDDVGMKEMAALFREADAMVLPTRGEGFNLPAAEAMAAGIPLIVTGYGGHMDFCNEANARLVDYRLAPSRSHLATPMSLWVEPEVADLAAAMREVHEDRAGREARARQAHMVATRLLSREAFVQRIEAASIETIMRPPERPLRLCLVSSWNVRCGIADYTRFLVDGMRGAYQPIELSILSDTRNPEPGEADAHLRVRPAWTIGSPQADQSLRVAAESEDPDALLIQHQPGLIGWATLGSALLALAATQRVLAVTLHNTATLPELEKPERDLAVSGLQAATRVIVHTLIDLERLRAMGIADNVVLIAQGAPKLLAMKAERKLGANDIVTIGSCGFLLPGKGIPALIEAIGLLKSRWPRVRLRLLTADYGSKDSKAEASLARTIARETGLEADVELVTDFLPYEKLRAGMAECDVVVLPYPPSKEGSSAALRTAVSSGACVAVTPIDLFADAADAVWRLPGIDAAAIADGLGTLLADRDLRMATQRAARRWLTERGWNVVGARTIGMLRGLAASRTSIKGAGMPDREPLARGADTRDLARAAEFV
jgi:glycosyltransferase involved in cell wall biosynthesis